MWKRLSVTEVRALLWKLSPQQPGQSTGVRKSPLSFLSNENDLNSYLVGNGF